ncbi:MAG TPA: asparagine synthase-related protein, partial [Tepidisphaeraceae bacterium]|nr:asparagine synthase-related protein [Tepidisphaeraceae bacterium]
LSYGYTLGCTTIYEGAAKVEPGHFLHALPDRPPKTARYFDCNAGWLEPGRRPDCEARDRTRKHLREAVTRQLVADVPLGCFLSGGIDSSIIASLMRARGKTACTFSVRFEDPRHDESAHAAAVARHLGTEHECFTVRADAAADLPRLATVFGEPFADSSALPTHYLAREVRKRVKVALSGDGGDELFGGYDRYRAMALAERVRSVPGLRHALLPNVLRWLPGHHPKSLMTRAKRFASSVALAADERYEQYIRIFDQNAVDELLGVKTLEFPYEHQGTRSGRDPVEKALAWDRLCYLPDDLLTKVDRASMLHGLEVRSPFMDHELVQFAAGLTTDQLLKGGPKRMLREAFADVLPAWVFKRRKMGFAVPIGEWFRTDAPLRAMLHDCLFAADAFGRGHFDMAVVRRLVDEHMAERVDHSQRLYALLMLELWWRSTR